MAPLPQPVRLTVYGRTYCHLCEEMIAALQGMQGPHTFEIELVDVDQDPELEARFGEWVPVLCHGDVRICHYHLDRERLTAHLDAFR
jgi:thioredoxin reductase (NADPH)